MHRRIDSLLAHEGYPTPPRVPINKSAGVGERFVSIRSNYLAAEQRLDALNDLPLRSGPTRMRKTVDAATAAAADKAAALALHYEQIANTVNDRDLADSYRTLAKNARTEAAK
jgi:hypothetical protein